MKNRVLVMVFILVQLVGVLFAQKEVSERKIIYKGRKIEFQNLRTGETENVFDIEDNNPYRNEPFVINENKVSYDMTGVTFADFLPNISQYDQEVIERFNKTIDYASISGTPYRYAPDYVSITYDFVVWNRNDSSIFKKSQIKVLNNEGIVLHTIDPDASVLKQVITNDGKYLCIAYVYSDHNITRNKGFGVRIYDLENNSVIFDNWSVSSLIGIFISHDLCFFESDEYNDNEKQTSYRIFDFKEKKIYSKTFSWEERCRLKEIKKDSFIFKTNRSENKIEKYEYKNDFTVETY